MSIEQQETGTRGKFIVISGCDQDKNRGLAIAIAKALEAQGLEPYTTALLSNKFGRYVGNALHVPSIEELDPIAELMLEAGALAQQVSEEIRPHLESGQPVICVGYMTSIIARHEAAGHGVAAEAIQGWVTSGLDPDISLMLDSDAETAAHGLVQDGMTRARLAIDTGFMERLRQSYLRLVRDNRERYRLLDATLENAALVNQAMKIIDYMQSTEAGYAAPVAG